MAFYFTPAQLQDSPEPQDDDRVACVEATQRIGRGVDPANAINRRVQVQFLQLRLKPNDDPLGSFYWFGTEEEKIRSAILALTGAIDTHSITAASVERFYGW